MYSALQFWFTAAILAALAYTILQFVLIGRCLMATQADVDKLTAQVVKIGNEVKSVHAALSVELAGLKAQLAAGVTPQDIDLSGLAAAIQSVDDINADPVVDEPVEEDPAVVDPEPVDPVEEPVEQPVVEEPAAPVE